MFFGKGSAFSPVHAICIGGLLIAWLLLLVSVFQNNKTSETPMVSSQEVCKVFKNIMLCFCIEYPIMNV